MGRKPTRTHPWRTPKQFLKVFEHWSREYPDSQFSDGLPIIRAWMSLRSRPTVSQTDLDALLDRFAAAGEGMQIYDLWLHVVRWGEKLGLSVPSRNPWAQPLTQVARDAGERTDGLTTEQREGFRRIRDTVRQLREEREREIRQLRDERAIWSKAAAWVARETPPIPSKDSSS